MGSAPRHKYVFFNFFFLKIVCRNNNSQPWTDTWVQFTDRVNHTNFKSSDKWRHCDRVLICTSENNVLMKHSHPQSLFSIIYPRLWNKMHVTRFEIYKNTCKWSKTNTRLTQKVSLWCGVERDPLCQRANRSLSASTGSVCGRRWITVISMTDRPRDGRLFFWAPYLSRTEGSVYVPNSSITIRPHTGSGPAFTL